MSFVGELREFLRHSVLARVGLTIACVLIVVALLAPSISPADPASQNLAARLEGALDGDG
jgi:hypothetical protein